MTHAEKKVNGGPDHAVHPHLRFLHNNSALRPRRVDAELDPGGRGKELVREGLNTLRARLATIRARLDVQN